jgi:hypothetical protein
MKTYFCATSLSLDCQIFHIFVVRNACLSFKVQAICTITLARNIYLKNQKGYFIKSCCEYHLGIRLDRVAEFIGWSSLHAVLPKPDAVR